LVLVRLPVQAANRLDVPFPLSGSMSLPFRNKIRADALLLLERDGRFTGGDKAAGLPDHDDDHGQAEEQHTILDGVEARTEDLREEAEITESLGSADHHDGSDDNADLRGQSAKYNDGQDDCGSQ